MEIMILHDPRNLDNDWELCQQELERQGICAYWRELSVQAETVVESINMTHKRAVYFAKYKGLPEVCIMESDVMFPAADGWEYFLRNKPDSFDLYLAGTYGDFDYHTEGGYYVRRPAGFHCYIIHEKYYDKFLATPPELHIDDAQEGWFSLCYPFAALQRPGWSATAKRKVNYNNDLLNNRKEDVYGW